jgi:hypothetical protein
MNTRTKLLLLAIAVAVEIRSSPCAIGAGKDFLILGDWGQLFSVSALGSKKQIMPIDLPPPEGRVVDAYFEQSGKKLFVTTDDAKLYELDLTTKLEGYKRIETTNDLPFYIWYDRREKQPAWLHLVDGESEAEIRFRDKDSHIRSSSPDDIEFSHGFVFGMHIDGWKTSRELSAKNSPLAFLTNEYPDAEWMIVGRSENVVVYGQRMANLLEEGEVFKATYLFHDRVNNRWRVKAFPERCDVTVFKSIVVIQGFYDLKGDKDPITGNGIQGRPSGNWYFYIPENNTFLAHKLNMSLSVNYATPEWAVASGGGRIVTLEIKGDKQAPEFLVEVPEGLVISAICPL